MLCKTHQHYDPASDLKVAFPPFFSTTQSGFSILGNMNVMSFCLANLVSFLLVRDDNDFEAILSKEVVSSSSALLQILGYFVIEELKDTKFMDVKNEIRTGGAGTGAAKKICATSSKPLTISVFAATSSVSYRPVDGAQVNTQEIADCHNLNFSFTLMLQDRRYFCRSINCYKTSWVFEHIEPNHFVNCVFLFNETVPQENMRSVFLLT